MVNMRVLLWGCRGGDIERVGRSDLVIVWVGGGGHRHP